MSIDLVTLRRFWSKIEVGDPDDCWLWSSSKTALFRYEGQPISAPRFALQLSIGRDLAPTMQCNHKCISGGMCCNPNHLYEGTQLQNMQDMDRQGRRVSWNASKEVCPICNGSFSWIFRTSGKDYRYCKSCSNAKQRKKYAEKKAATPTS